MGTMSTLPNPARSTASSGISGTSGSSGSSASGATARQLWAFPVDVVAVILFAALGRSAHSRAPGLMGLVQTAWPFLTALLLGWLVWLVLRRGSALTFGTGVWMWLFTLVAGMVIWGVRDAKIPHYSFLIVAGVATLILLVGWRLVARLMLRRRVA